MMKILVVEVNLIAICIMTAERWQTLYKHCIGRQMEKLIVLIFVNCSGILENLLPSNFINTYI